MAVQTETDLSVVLTERPTKTTASGNVHRLAGKAEEPVSLGLKTTVIAAVTTNQSVAKTELPLTTTAF